MAKDRILIYSSTPLVGGHIGTELDIAKSYMYKGYDVHFAVCKEVMLSCDTNINKERGICALCTLNLEHGLELINIPVENIHYIDNMVVDIDIPKFGNIDELKEYKIGSIDVGSSIASFLITSYRECDLDISDKQELIGRCIRTSYLLNRGFLKILNNVHPSKVFIYNGRFFTKRVILRTVQNSGISAICVDMGIENNNYQYVKNSYMHDLEKVKRDINRFYSYSGDYKAVRNKIASAWYEDKRNGINQGIYNYTEGHKDILPDNFDKNKLNIVIFNSSEDEYESIDIWKDRFYNRQIEILNWIGNNITDNYYHFYLRVHPNLKNIDNSQTKAIDSLNYENITVIKANDDISSYKLLDNCDKVITFGSTMGVEATFYGKPSILIGRSFYESLNCCYIANNYDDLFHLITTYLKVKPMTGAYKYGYYQSKCNVKYNYLKYEDNKLSFDGKSLQPPVGKVISRMEKLFERLK